MKAAFRQLEYWSANNFRWGTPQSAAVSALFVKCDGAHMGRKAARSSAATRNQ